MIPALFIKIILEKDLSIYQTVDEGIENRLKKKILNANSWKELIEKVKTKRYTYNKINRMLVHILTSFTKEEAKKIEIDYIKILGFNTSGRNYLNQLKIRNGQMQELNYHRYKYLLLTHKV